MKLILPILILVFASSAVAQERNSLILSGMLLENNTRYHFGKYTKGANTLREFDLSFYRQVDNYKNWYLGAGLGYRKISLNEASPVSLTDQNILIHSIFIRVTLRHEKFLGRKGKFFIEGGPGYCPAGKVTSVNTFDEDVEGNELRKGFHISGKTGYQYNVNERTAVYLAFSSITDVGKSMLLYSREVRFSNSTFISGLRYNF